MIDVEELRRTYRWFLAAGIALVILGVIALAWFVLTTLVAGSEVIFAWLLVINGLAYLIWGFASRNFGRDLLPSGAELRHIGTEIIDHLRTGSRSTPAEGRRGRAASPRSRL